jgi:hypothetical protein
MNILDRVTVKNTFEEEGLGEGSLELSDLLSLKNVIEEFNMPSELFQELTLFASRNLLPYERQNNQKRVCIRCFRAFLINAAKAYGLDDLQIKVLMLALGRGFVGHNGFYIDGESLQRVSDIQPKLLI